GPGAAFANSGRIARNGYRQRRSYRRGRLAGKSARYHWRREGVARDRLAGRRWADAAAERRFQWSRAHQLRRHDAGAAENSRRRTVVSRHYGEGVLGCPAAAEARAYWRAAGRAGAGCGIRQAQALDRGCLPDRSGRRCRARKRRTWPQGQDRHQGYGNTLTWVRAPAASIGATFFSAGAL